MVKTFACSNANEEFDSIFFLITLLVNVNTGAFEKKMHCYEMICYYV